MLVEEEFHVRTGQVMTDATLTCVVVPLVMPLQSNHSVSHWSLLCFRSRLLTGARNYLTQKLIVPPTFYFVGHLVEMFHVKAMK